MEVSKYLPKEVNPKMMAYAFAATTMQFSVDYQQEVLNVINERICEIRADIISGNKTTDEINMLLDELQTLSVKKRDTEGMIISIKHFRETRSKLDETLAKDDELVEDIEQEEES